MSHAGDALSPRGCLGSGWASEKSEQLMERDRRLLESCVRHTHPVFRNMARNTHTYALHCAMK